MYNLLQQFILVRWNADAATQKALANSLAKSIIANGWTGDPLDMDIVNEMLQNMDTKLVDGVKSKLYASTLNSAFAPSTPQNPTNPQNPSTPQEGGSSSNGGSSAPGQIASGVAYAAASSSQSSSASAQSSAGSSGQKAYEVSQKNQSSSKQSDLPIYAIIGIISILALVGVGYFFGPRKTQ